MTLPTDRARRHTAEAVQSRIDQQTSFHLLDAAAGMLDTGQRLQALEREWDLDRVLEVQTAGVGLLGLALGATLDRRFLLLPALAGAALCLFALSGRHPLLPLARRAGVRSAREIQRERAAHKALRGDFAGLGSQPAAAS